MDMAGIIDYAKQNGVGVVLWSSWRNLVQRGHQKMEEIMKHYGDMGVKGFKVDFFDRDDQKAINSVYDRVIPMDGKLGEYVVVAKMKGNRWYVAAMNNWQSRDITIDLSDIYKSGKSEITGFKGKANIFADGINADREATDYKHTYQQLEGKDKLTVHLAPGGGWTAIIE